MTERILKLKHLLEKDSPILFLGAGFSLGAKISAANGYIPDANKLKILIIEEYLKYEVGSAEYTELSGYTLSKLCQYAVLETSKDHLNDYLGNIFRNCIPAEYHTRIYNYGWRKIYSTNIDDLLETICKEKNVKLLVQNSKRKSTLRVNDSCEYLKLHGCVNNKSEGYTFSVDDYIKSINSTLDYRMNSFCIDMQTDNFVFLGTEFDEENISAFLDLYKNSGYESSRGKIVCLNPRPSLLLKKKIGELNGVLIEWTTEQFVDFLGTLNKSTKRVDEIDRKLFYKGFLNVEKIKSSIVKKSNYVSDLYFGYEPKWEDIIFDWDFISPDVSRILSDIDSSVSVKNVSIFSVYGKGYVGKTCILKRLALSLSGKGYKVIYFQGKELDFSSIQEFLRYYDKPTVLVIDNGSQYYSTLPMLSKRINSSNKLIVLTASRPYYHLKRRYFLLDADLHEYEIPSKIEPAFAKTILIKLKEKGYLGELSKLNNETKQIRFLSDQSDLMSSMIGVTYGKGFIDRFKKDLNSFIWKVGEDRDLVIDAAIFDKAELPNVPIEIFPLIYRTRTNDLVSKSENFIKQINNKAFAVRNSIFSDNIISARKYDYILGRIKLILIAISPQVQEWENSYWKQIYESLGKVKILSKNFKFNIEVIKTLYYDLKDYYSETSYYWLQLGLAEQISGDYERALNHFRQAEALRPLSYQIQHVIGRNFMKQANSKGTLDDAAPFFKEGEDMLLTLIKHREYAQIRSYSVHCYLYEKIRHVKKFDVQLSDSEINEMFRLLKLLISKDPNDIMAKNISNHFYSYIKSINKQGLIKMKLYELKNYSAMFRNRLFSDTEIDDFIGDIDMN